MKIQSFKDLEAWKEGHRLVLEIYKITKEFPKEERFALIDQMRRAAISITSNVAEGFSRQSLKEKIQFYSTALGSATELQNQIYIAKDLDYMKDERFKAIAGRATRVHKLLNGLIKYCKNKI